MYHILYYIVSKSKVPLYCKIMTPWLDLIWWLDYDSSFHWTTHLIRIHVSNCVVCLQNWKTRVERNANSLLCYTEFIYPPIYKNWHKFWKKHYGKTLICSNRIVRVNICKFDFRFKIWRCSTIFLDLYFFLPENCTFHLFSSRRFYFILLINNIIIKLNTKKKIKYCSETFERSEEIWRNMNMYISIYEIWRKLIKIMR